MTEHLPPSAKPVLSDKARLLSPNDPVLKMLKEKAIEWRQKKLAEKQQTEN